MERVVLLGFMASGKSTVGSLLARALGWEHLDLDEEIERHAGRSVAEIFAEPGEARFRELEVELTRRLLERPRLVLSPGGGWVTNRAVWEELPRATLTVWLRVSPEEALRRIAGDRGGRERPLARGPDPEADVRRLLREREPLYRRAAVTVETDGRDARDVALEIEQLVRGRAASPSEVDPREHAE